MIDPVLTNKTSFSHFENSLLSIILNPGADKRSLSLSQRGISKGRTASRQTANVREFCVRRKIRFDVPSYVDIIDWTDCVGLTH